MEGEKIVILAREAVRLNRYMLIQYNGSYRNVYPISFRRGPGGLRMHAWCEIHPEESSESFLIDKITFSQLSEDVALIKPSFVSEI